MHETTAPELRDSNLPVELSQYLFDIQMGKLLLRLRGGLLIDLFLISVLS